ncbi:MAG TPA: helix-turn-helix domain-containing protein, partial [Candidatus Methylomirabilis sp.]
VKGISSQALPLLQHYSWPGNVRELQNCMERAVILCPQGEVGRQHIQFGPDRGEDALEISLASSGSLLEASSKAARAVEKRLIQEALQESKGNKWQASKRLRVSYKTLFSKIKELEIET